ncbi:MAG: hypothetical protein M3132_11805, partial [Actinomycetia bacterium]|nr:hypothetical protein [Actinomycetes bacterium]
MGEYYRDAIPTTKTTFYKGEGHFIMYSRANEILKSLSPASHRSHNTFRSETDNRSIQHTSIET